MFSVEQKTRRLRKFHCEIRVTWPKFKFWHVSKQHRSWSVTQVTEKVDFRERKTTKKLILLLTKCWKTWSVWDYMHENIIMLTQKLVIRIEVFSNTYRTGCKINELTNAPQTRAIYPANCGCLGTSSAQNSVHVVYQDLCWIKQTFVKPFWELDQNHAEMGWKPFWVSALTVSCMFSKIFCRRKLRGRFLFTKLFRFWIRML